MLTRFLTLNTPGMKATRTVVQGAMTALVLALPSLLVHYELPYWFVAVAFPTIMAGLAATMGVMRTTMTYDVEGTD